MNDQELKLKADFNTHLATVEQAIAGGDEAELLRVTGAYEATRARYLKLFVMEEDDETVSLLKRDDVVQRKLQGTIESGIIAKRWEEKNFRRREEIACHA